MKNSSSTSTSRTLAHVTTSQAKRFLVELANLVHEGNSVARFRVRYGHIMPHPLSPSAKRQVSLLRVVFEGDIKIPIEIFMLQNGLRSIWAAPDQRTKAWGIFRLVDEIEIWCNSPPSMITLGALNWANGRVIAIPEPSAFEQAMDYLRHRGHLARICPNAACPAPYFFAARRTQKYCSEVCAQPSQREFKRKWWAAIGNSRRTKLKRSTRRKGQQHS
jgi:hypothetical protein